MDDKVYYDLNVQIFDTPEGTIVYSVIQEFDEDGKDTEIIAYGEVETLPTAIDAVKQSLLDVLDE